MLGYMLQAIDLLLELFGAADLFLEIHLFFVFHVADYYLQFVALGKDSMALHFCSILVSLCSSEK